MKSFLKRIWQKIIIIFTSSCPSCGNPLIISDYDDRSNKLVYTCTKCNQKFI